MPGKILCIDDSATIRMLLKKNLEPEGYEVIEAADGRQGLDVAKTEKIDLFIVDVNMPVMDGFEFVGKLKETNQASVPVVFLTTESSLEKKSLGKSLGVNGWIVKPFDPPSLIKVVSMLVK